MTDKLKIAEKIAVVAAKQAQNRTEQKSNEANGEKLAIELKELKAELKAADMPEFRHGDYGVWLATNQCFTVDMSEGGVIHLLWVGGEKRNTWSTNSRVLKKNAIILGNIFDDLKALKEPLTEFEVDGCEFKLNRMAVGIKTRGSSFWDVFSLDEAEEMASNLKRLVYTARSEK